MDQDFFKNYNHDNEDIDLDLNLDGMDFSLDNNEESEPDLDLNLNLYDNMELGVDVNADSSKWTDEPQIHRKKSHGGLIALLVILLIAAATAVVIMLMARNGMLTGDTGDETGAEAAETAAVTEAAETETPYETAEAVETPAAAEVTEENTTVDGADVNYSELPQDMVLLKYVPEGSGTLIYVNNHGEEIQDAVTADGTPSLQLDRNAAAQAAQLIAAAQAAGYELIISQGYRAVEDTGYLDVAEHFTGLCVDLNDAATVRGTFVKDEAYAEEVQWLKDNAAAYGFVMTEEADEDGNSMAYHYAYVGTDVAANVAANGGYLNSYTG